MDGHPDEVEVDAALREGADVDEVLDEPAKDERGEAGTQHVMLRELCAGAAAHDHDDAQHLEEDGALGLRLDGRQHELFVP